jgi:hypothetical protein
MLTGGTVVADGPTDQILDDVGQPVRVLGR